MDTVTTVAPTTYQMLPVQAIVPSRHQARKDFDPESLRGLADSMLAEGLLEPILVRKTGESFELISGERRLRAAKLLAWKEIEAKVIETDSEAEAAAKGLVENLQREDLNPMEEAEGFRDLDQLDPKLWTQEKIAQIAGKRQSYISDSLRLLTLPPEIVENIRRRIFSRSHGVELTRLNDLNQQLDVARQIPGKLTREETRALVDEMLGKSKSNGAPAKPHAAPVDPLAKLWISLRSNPLAPQGNWAPKYAGHGTWHFTINLGEFPSERLMTGWFRNMTQAMPRPIEQEDIAVASVPNAATIRPDTSSSGHPRQPKNVLERQELEAAIMMGPAHAFGWLFGYDSDRAQQYIGKSWEQLGYHDPHKAIKEILNAPKSN